MKQTVLFLSLMALLAVSCKEKSKPELVAERFLSAYLDCRYQDAERLATPEVMEQMRWRLSQLTQAEVELINDNAPQVSTEEVEICGDSCFITILASDALLLDSIGLPAHVSDQQYRLMLLKEKGSNWKVTALVPNL